MAQRGRPRLTEDQYRARLEAYCAQYGVRPTTEGIPPFPAGRRETAQHRQWLGLYKAHSRLLQKAELGAAAEERCPLCESDLAGASPAVLKRVRGYLAGQRASK